MKFRKCLPNIANWKAFAELRTKKLIILSGTPFQNNIEELRTIMRLLLPANDEAMYFFNLLTLDKVTYRRVDEIRKNLDQLVHIHSGSILDKSLKGLRELVVILNLFLARKGSLQ
jgi:DNA repair and recombination RAD54-like protein